nr:glycine-rich cell wall structural protein 1.0-like [Aegilops tauschii subsp. strangulata]
MEANGAGGGVGRALARRGCGEARPVARAAAVADGAAAIGRQGGGGSSTRGAGARPSGVRGRSSAGRAEGKGGVGGARAKTSAAAGLTMPGPNGSSVQRGGGTRAGKGRSGRGARTGLWPWRGAGPGRVLAGRRPWQGGRSRPEWGQRGEGRGQKRRRASAAAERDGKYGGGLGTQCVATGSRG